MKQFLINEELLQKINTTHAYCINQLQKMDFAFKDVVIQAFANDFNIYNLEITKGEVKEEKLIADNTQQAPSQSQKKAK